jgi:phosphohistidine phosphatase SixA
VALIVVRHASAGDRVAWEGDDRLRPLDDRGRAQADELVKLLSDYAIDRIVSSPALRCVQTVEPLARARKLEIEPREQLAEERHVPDGVELGLGLRNEEAVMCCHGGFPEALAGEKLKKGAVLVLETDRDRLRPVARLKPPA